MNSRETRGIFALLVIATGLALAGAIVIATGSLVVGVVLVLLGATALAVRFARFGRVP